MDGAQSPSRVVYRALVGAYERLSEVPVAAGSGVDFVCFTDDPSLASETWRVVVVEPRFPTDAYRSARHLKIVGHPELEEYDEWLWVDNTVDLLVSPEQILDDWLANTDLALPAHSHRTSVLEEAEAVLDAGRDDFVRVYEQIAAYLRHHPDRVEANPHWTGMLARRRTPVVTAAMQAWWEHVLRYSHRDQLSFAIAVPRPGLRLRSVELDNHSSPWHRWPAAAGRRADRPGAGLREALRPAGGEVAALRARVEDVEARHRSEVGEAKERILELESELLVVHGRLQESTAVTDRLSRRIGSLRARIAELKGEPEIGQSPADGTLVVPRPSDT